MTRRRLPLGIQNFRELRELDCYYVGKTLSRPQSDTVNTTTPYILCALGLGYLPTPS